MTKRKDMKKKRKRKGREERGWDGGREMRIREEKENRRLSSCLRILSILATTPFAVAYLLVFLWENVIVTSRAIYDKIAECMAANSDRQTDR